MAKQEGENRITRLNYNARAQALLNIAFLCVDAPIVGPTYGVLQRAAMASCSIWRKEENSLAVFRNRTFEIGVPIWLMGVQEVVGKSQEGTAIDPLFFGGLALNAGIYYLYDKAAQALYNSGITQPIYRWLHIRDRRIQAIKPGIS